MFVALLSDYFWNISLFWKVVVVTPTHTGFEYLFR